MRKELPEVLDAAREAGAWEQVRIGDSRIELHGIYADPDLFAMMNFPPLEGDPVAVLRDPNAVVLCASAARKLFGGAPAMHMPLHWTIFALAGGIAIGVALLTVSFQGMRVAKENPATKLRSE